MLLMGDRHSVCLPCWSHRVEKLKLIYGRMGDRGEERGAWSSRVCVFFSDLSPFFSEFPCLYLGAFYIPFFG